MTNESKGKANELLQKLVAGIIARHEKGSRFGISAEEACKLRFYIEETVGACNGRD